MGPSATVGMFWDIHVDFWRFIVQGDELDCNVTTDWITTPVRDWRNLEGLIVEGNGEVMDAAFTIHDLDNGGYSTFFIYDDDLGSWTKIAFGSRNALTFAATIDMKIRLPADSAARAWPRPTVYSVHDVDLHTQVELSYEGFAIDRRLIAGHDDNRDKALQMAAGYVDLGCFEAARIRYEQFVFEPLDVGTVG